MRMRMRKNSCIIATGYPIGMGIPVSNG